LALDPIALLFDEPTAGLDPITAGEIADPIVRLKAQKERAATVVTHDIHSVKVFADVNHPLLVLQTRNSMEVLVHRGLTAAMMESTFVTGRG
jgi:phospholipid/cholesterol/gamma-HCH transport system ATP-binding protein